MASAHHAGRQCSGESSSDYVPDMNRHKLDMDFFPLSTLKPTASPRFHTSTSSRHKAFPGVCHYSFEYDLCLYRLFDSDGILFSYPNRRSSCCQSNVPWKSKEECKVGDCPWPALLNFHPFSSRPRSLKSSTYYMVKVLFSVHPAQKMQSHGNVMIIP